jgi:catechol 2,3-dioxygenase-like lactoylglutathione lyase family enzyme
VPPVPGLDHVVIAVSDLARSDDFYARVLGAAVVEPAPGRRAYDVGGSRLNVHHPAGQPDLVARVPVAPGGSDLCFEWDGPIADAVAHLAACGVAVEVGPVPRAGARGTGTSVYFRDPDGSLLELISYVD